jgi:1,4-alpha-glucan branching enzyme
MLVLINFPARMLMLQGYLVLALHAHLPYVLSHGTWPHGSDWLNEAVCETYLPLLNVLDRISSEGGKANLTLGITPVLCEMLASPVFKKGLKEYVRERMEAAAKDRKYFEKKKERSMAVLAQRWYDLYESLFLDFVGKYDEDLIGAFRRFQEEGQIEIFTSAATHAYLPLLSLDSSVSAQIKQGIETYKKHFLREPKGMWLPECAYRPGADGPDPAGRMSGQKGIEAFLSENGIDYFFLDSHHLRGTGPMPDYGHALPWADGRMGGFHPGGKEIYDMYSERYEGLRRLDRGPDERRALSSDQEKSPYATYYAGPAKGRRGCAFFARQADISLQVWSGQWGYPGDGNYLEFHKKHFPSGLRYWKVTDRTSGLGEKATYEPDRAAKTLLSHASHFKDLVTGHLESYISEEGKPGVATTPFDAELFGHWWFEGIDWLYHVTRLFQKNGQKNGRVAIEKASTVLERIGPEQTVDLPEGSWGAGGGHFIWYNEETLWMWEQIHEAEIAMSRTAALAADMDQFSRRIARQMARELFLLQASDWEFLISTAGAKDYAEERFRTHYSDFKGLGTALQHYHENGSLPDTMLQTLTHLEARDNLFDNVKIEWFQERT